MSRPLRLGLLGRGIGRSRSPDLHAAALKACAMAGDSTLFDCADVAQAKATLDLLRSGHLDGLNVTTPYKAWAAAACEAFVRGEGAPSPGTPPLPVNTLFLRDEMLCGASTDGPGLRDALRWAGVALAGKGAVLLGCGGAGQAIAGDLLAAGLQRLVLCSRDPASALQLAGSLGDSRVSTAPWGEAAALRDADLVLHATRLGHGLAGMQPDASAAWAWLPWQAWRESGVLLWDLAYAPEDTPWQALARREGVRFQPHSGQAMLAAQAARSFALWTGCLPEGRALLQAILPDGYQLYMSEP